MAENKDFATIGTESFKIAGQEANEHIVLNIQDDSNVGIVIDEDSNKKKKSSILDSGVFQSLNSFLISQSKVKERDKATFFHLLSVMINAGIPMIKALKALGNQMEKSPRLQMIIEEISTAIEDGGSLSDAMFNYDKVFSESEIGMVKSGEASGQLSRVLSNLAKDAEKATMIKSKIKGAMIYPAVILCLLIVVVVGMMVWVIPKLTELFAASKGQLPFVTRAVVGLSNLLINHGVLIVIGMIFVICFLVLFGRTDIGKFWYDEIKINVPIFGPLFKKAYLARFARSLSNLIDSNVSILKTLEITANSIGNEVYRKRLLLSLEDIRQGIPLAENLSSSNLFPPMLVSMIDVGEKTAQLDTITEKIANFYEEEIDTAVAGISKIIEPVILVILGGTVGIVVAAIMLPIMQLSDLTSNF